MSLLLRQPERHEPLGPFANRGVGGVFPSSPERRPWRASFLKLASARARAAVERSSLLSSSMFVSFRSGLKRRNGVFLKIQFCALKPEAIAWSIIFRNHHPTE